MPLPRLSRRLLFGLTLLAVAPSIRVCPHAGAQAPQPVNRADRIYGADNCIRCHESPRDNDRRPGGALEFIRLDESAIWQNQDLHAKSFEALSSPLGQRMQTVLGYDVTRRSECLACHAVDLMPEKKPAEKVADDFFTKFGVGCEACHGFAHDWERAHSRADWRDVPPAEKWKVGQVDVRDPATRAGRCAACHVGDAGTGKVVTHEMYAAGHPPLPPLEVMTFSRDEPMHYKLAKDLKYFETLDPTKAWNLFHYRKGESQPARHMAVGAVATFRAAVGTLAPAAESAHSRGGLLDFAHFDCAACHHDLKVPSWRQQRGYVGSPGRPLPNVGPLSLLRVVLEHAASVAPAVKSTADDFAAKQARLQQAFDARPFGDPAAIVPAARELAGWADTAAKALDGVVYTPEETRRLLTLIARTAAAPAATGSPGLDFDAAQQLLWAFEVLHAEVPELPPAVATELKALTDTGMLGRLRNPDQPRVLLSDSAGGALSERLKRIAGYDPVAFQAGFEKIAAALGSGR